jgi:hypothetical protein
LSYRDFWDRKNEKSYAIKMRLLTPDVEITLYPKDQATKATWIAQAHTRGYTILEA